ncbi:hypothetical protein ACFX10_023361 [Malus domestica]
MLLSLLANPRTLLQQTSRTLVKICVLKVQVTDHPRSARPQNFSCKTTADVGNGKDMNAATGPSLTVYGNSPVPHSKRARPRLQISAG